MNGYSRNKLAGDCKGIYYNKSARHWRVRISSNVEKQKHIGTTTLNETVAAAMYDLYIYLNGLENTHHLNLPEWTICELFNLIGEHDPRALKNLMKKSKLKIISNEIWDH